MCQSWNSDNGACTACYGGYALSGADCVVSQTQATQSAQSGSAAAASTSSSSSSTIQGSSASTSTQQASSTAAAATKEIVGCAEYSANGLSCNKCSYRFYPLNGVCNKVSDLCKSWNINTGACVECYSGYAISGSDCALIGVSGSGAGSSSSSSGSSSNSGSSSGAASMGGSGAASGSGSQGGWQSTTTSTITSSQNNASGSQLRGSSRI